MTVIFVLKSSLLNAEGAKHAKELMGLKKVFLMAALIAIGVTFGVFGVLNLIDFKRLD